jgi:hypothetical protein
LVRGEGISDVKLGEKGVLVRGEGISDVKLGEKGVLVRGEGISDVKLGEKGVLVRGKGYKLREKGVLVRLAMRWQTMGEGGGTVRCLKSIISFFTGQHPSTPLTWNTMCFPKVCLTHLTTYSVSLSVNSTGLSDDLNSGPSLENSAIADNCSIQRQQELDTVTLTPSNVD